MKERISNIPPVPKAQKVFWWIVRGGLIVCFLYALFFLANENSPLYKPDGTTKVSQAIAAFCLTFVWTIVQFFGGKTWLRHISPRVQTCINVFMLFGCCICSYLYLYERWGFTDIAMHTGAGAIIAVGGYELLMAMQHDSKKSLTLPTVVLWVFMTVVLISVVWEIYEFTVDVILGSNMQIRFERLIANWASSGGSVHFFDASGAPCEYTKSAWFTVDGMLRTTDMNSGLYDTMTDVLVAIFGGVIAEIVIIKTSFKKLRKESQEEQEVAK